MSPQRWARIRLAVETALDAEPAQRSAILEATCHDDEEIAEALALLDHDDADLTVRSPCHGAAEDVFAALEAQRYIGRTLGNYRLTSLIATGGMGDVYKAERTDGAFQATVAVKLVRAGGSEARRRFARERRTLARLSHPSIARLIDAGEDGDTAYLVMDYVEGRPLMEYCRDLSMRQRVRIMRDVCAAVAHAHRALIVHRDLKPANILVTDDGTAQLLDFGISKLLAATDEPTLTSAQLFTPRYAAPEQICGEPVTTATDVYSLGVVLYEVLTGAPWPDRPGTPPWERRPPRPSIANHQIDRELDAIVQQSAAADPDQRYPTADALRDDLDRYLDASPVRALPASKAYRARKWAARHKPAIGVAALIAVLLVGAIVVPSVLALRLSAERERTLAATRSTERINAFLSDTIRAASESEFGGQLTLSALLDDALSRLHELDDADPAARAELRMTLAGALASIGREVDAEGQYAMAVDEYRQAAARVSQIKALIAHGASLRNLGRLDESKTALLTALDMHPSDADAMAAHRLLAFTYTTCGEFDLAEQQSLAALKLADHVGQEIDILDSLAEMYGISGRPAEGVDQRRRIVELTRASFGDGALAAARMRLARSLRMAGEYDEAVEVGRLGVDGAPTPSEANFHRVELAMCLEQAGDPDGAIDMLTAALEGIASEMPGDYPTLVYFREWLGLMLVRHDRFDEARPIIADVLANYTRTLGADHQRTRYARRTLERIDDRLD